MPTYNAGDDDMSFISAVKSGFLSYVNFTGRAARSELWYWMLFAVIVVGGFGVTDQLLYPGTQMGFFSYVDMIVFFGAISPTVAVVVRRINDVGRGARLHTETNIMARN
jgi:uncharacterized membrane protein YhaH (DUF805 family)